jgi:hypothetical protein
LRYIVLYQQSSHVQDFVIFTKAAGKKARSLPGLICYCVTLSATRVNVGHQCFGMLAHKVFNTVPLTAAPPARYAAQSKARVQWW